MGAVTPATPARISPRAIEQASAALDWLRGQRISVSVASHSWQGTRYYVSGYPNTFGAADLVELAQSKGFAAS
ncbi:hypothetical protein ACPVPU_07415 [Sphingomonas sp. CJ99]